MGRAVCGSRRRLRRHGGCRRTERAVLGGSGCGPTRHGDPRVRGTAGRPCRHLPPLERRAGRARRLGTHPSCARLLELPCARRAPARSSVLPFAFPGHRPRGRRRDLESRCAVRFPPWLRRGADDQRASEDRDGGRRDGHDRPQPGGRRSSRRRRRNYCTPTRGLPEGIPGPRADRLARATEIRRSGETGETQRRRRFPIAAHPCPPAREGNRRVCRR